MSSDAPKVKMLNAESNSQTPSEKIINKNLQLFFTDSQGRIIELEIPDVLDRYDFMRAMGKDSEVMSCVAMAAPLMYIKTLGGQPFKKPQTASEIRAGLKRLGMKGIEEVGNYLVESKIIDNGQAGEESKEELKK